MRKKMLSLALALVLALALAVPALAYGDMGKVGENNTVSGGRRYTGLIDENGSLWTWGHNEYGKLGNGSTEKSGTPVKVLDNVASVSCGDRHTAAIKTDGSLWTWGWNYYGQLGNGGGGNATDQYSGPHQTVPVKVLDNVAAVSCGGDHTAAIKTDGSLWMWGSNGAGQLGNGTKTVSSTPVKVLDNVVVVSCGQSHTAALKTDGTLWTWGSNGSGQLGNGGGQVDNGFTPTSLIPVKVLDNVAAVSCGFDHTAALKTDGSVWTWGRNDLGQLGNGGGGNATSPSSETIQTVPVKVLDGATAVNCGASHTAVIKTDGSLWIWGGNVYGALGKGSRVPSSTPVKVLDNVAAVNCGFNHTAVIKTDGSLWTWGGNAFGELGYEGGNDYFLGYIIQTIPKQVAGLTVAMPATLPTVSTTTPDTTTTGFTDVKSTDYFADAVAWAVDRGITSGTSDTTFSPSNTCTTSQILTFLWRADGSPEPKAANPFSDVKESDYFYKAALWASERGLVSGSTFGGDTPCTRAATVTYLWKLAGSPSVPAASFADVPSNSEYAPAVAYAVSTGITDGTSKTTFSPEGICTRSQIVTFIYRYRAFAN